MMSSEKYRLHPITAFLNFLSSLKNMLLPLIILFIGGNRQNESYEITGYLQNFNKVLMIATLCLILVSGLIKWWTYVYWFEDNELRVEFGFFVKNKRYIPFERIQSLNYNETLFHRLLGLVQVRVETAASNGQQAEANLTAITKLQAERIEEEMKKTKQRLLLEQDEIKQEQSSVIPAQIIHKMSRAHLVLLATTSGAIGIVLSSILAFISQFLEFIPLEEWYKEFSDVLQSSVFLVSMIGFTLLVLTWVIAVIVTVLQYYDFTVSRLEDKLVITRGLLEKKRVTLPLNRVQSIRIVENPFRQLFGYVSVFLESAGRGSDESGRKMVLFPLIKKGEELAPLRELFPDYDFAPILTISPKRARPFFYRLDILWTVPIFIGFGYSFYPYGLLSLLAIPLALLLGVWQYRTGGFAVSGKQLTLRFRRISRVTVYMQKYRIQALTSRQSYFQKRQQLASVQAEVMSASKGSKAVAIHLEEKHVKEIMSWFKYQFKNK